MLPFLMQYEISKNSIFVRGRGKRAWFMNESILPMDAINNLLEF